MVTTTSNVGVFDESFYRAMSDQALKYFMEDPQLNWVPQAIQGPLNAPQYKKPIYGASVGVGGAHQLGLPSNVMQTPKSHKVYGLEYVYGDIFYDMEDMMLEGKYLLQRKMQELNTWENQVKQSVFKGVFTQGFSSAGLGQGKRLNDGIVEQATLVENLNGTDSLMDAAGDVYKALSKIVGTIPFRYRDGKQVVIGCDDLFVRKARGALFRGATNQISELDLFLTEQSGPLGQNGQLVQPKLVVSDALFLNTVAGTTKTEADTVGTHSRLFATVIDPNILEQAYSFLGRVGEETHGTIQSLTERYAARVSGCVHDANAVVYSEQITWA
jgi:hypothetical protein